MSDQELKPCPFCQQKLKIVAGDMVHPISWCILSGVSCPVENTTTWNTRTPDPMLEELAGALQQMADIYYGRNNQPIAGAYARAMDEALQKYQQSKVQP